MPRLSCGESHDSPCGPLGALMRTAGLRPYQDSHARLASAPNRGLVRDELQGLSAGDAESRQVQEPGGGQVSRGFLAAPFQFAARQTLPCFAWAKPGMDRRRVGIPSHIYGRDPARVALMVAGTETQTRGGIGHGEACGPEGRFAALDAHAQSG